MRFKFPGPDDQIEAAARAGILAAMDHWWRALAGKTAEIDALFSGSAEWDLPGWMDEHLGLVDRRLMWEFGPAVKAPGHRLVISVESDRYLRPLLDELLRRAPAIPGWEIYPYRLPEPMKLAEATVRGRTQGTLEGLRVSVSLNDSGGVDLLFRSKACNGPEDEAARAVAFVATECLLGEEQLEHWIDGIEVDRLSTEATGEVAIAQLQAAVGEAITRWWTQLPDRPLVETIEDRTWSVLELQPEQADDYAHQHDLFVATTALLPMWQRAHAQRSFCSGRYSRFGETFCFLKIDGAEGLEGTEFSDRSAIADALQALLTREQLGAVVGGGTGRRYSYVDLALTDLPRAIAAVRARLRAGFLPRRAWLQFFDAELSREWIGVWDDSPAPFGIPEDLE